MKTTKKQAELHFVGRAQFKSNGLVLYRIQSGEKSYDVTMARGRVTSCCQTNGESCQGFKFQHKCRHAEYALAREQELAAVKEAERVVREEQKVSPVAAKVQEAAGIRDAIGIGDRGHLNGGPKAFSVLAV